MCVKEGCGLAVSRQREAPIAAGSFADQTIPDPVQMVLDWEWRQYDSDIIPNELFGDGITGDRIEAWKALYDCKENRQSQDAFL